MHVIHVFYHTINELNVISYHTFYKDYISYRTDHEDNILSYNM